MRRQYCVTDFGAVCNEKVQTAAFQAAIDACFSAGGGEVTVPAGVYLLGSVRLRSRVTLHLLENAVLKGSRNPDDYEGFVNDTLEPLQDEEDVAYKSPLRHWCNALIRAFRAHDVAIVGERGSVIDGQNCYDENGEEQFRGPHAVGMFGCTNVELCGYTIQDSGNWANQLTRCRNIYAHEVTVKAGHDGIHCRSCENIVIEDCTLYTGDDCVAGFDNLNMTVLRCKLSSACSAFRLGGTDILIDRCQIIGPGKYGHRWKMSVERKRAGEPTDERDRHNTLTGFLYYCWGDFDLKKTPGNITVQNCEFTNVDSLFISEFERHIWCCNSGLRDITFRNCRINGVCEPMQLYADPAVPMTVRIEDSELTFRDGAAEKPLAVGYDFDKLILQNVKIGGYNGEATVRIEPHEGVNTDPQVVLDGCTGVCVQDARR